MRGIINRKRRTVCHPEEGRRDFFGGEIGLLRYQSQAETASSISALQKKALLPYGFY
jgi:hypothetical protein